MELLRLDGATGPAIDFGATPGKASRWKLFGDLARIFRAMPEIAPAFFTEHRLKGTLKGFANLLWADPVIFSAAIAKASGANGITLLMLQFVGWTLLPSLILFSPFAVYHACMATVALSVYTALAGCMIAIGVLDLCALSIRLVGWPFFDDPI
jgi:hypothetical protein